MLMRTFKPNMHLKALFLWAVFFFLVAGSAVYAQSADRKISGRVTTADGKPMEAASVINKRTNVGTHSDNLGAYNILAQAGDVLVISYVGYQRKEVKVGKTDVINITVSEEQAKMDEVVVIGYG